MAEKPATTIYIMESANLICGDLASDGKKHPGASTHLVLQELKLPAMEENYVDHAPAGAPVAIEVPTHINRLEATFNLAGWDPTIMKYIAREDSWFQKFTAYGLIRDRRSAAALKATAVISGRLGRVNPTAFSKGNLMAHEYSIRSITSYELTMELDPNSHSKDIIYKWDFFTSTFKTGDWDINERLVSILGING
jgi:phage tail tube protein FII